MLSIDKKQNILLYSQPVDSRNRFNGLLNIIRSKMFCDPDNGFIYAFINKRKNMLVMLECEDDGIWLYTKRLEAGGVFERPLLEIKNNATLISASALLFIINGAVGNIKFRKRYSLKREANNN
jgi:hypothetical protein